MKKKFRFAGVIFWVVVLLAVLASGSKASADSLPVVLSSAQTLALYGTEIPALWYNGQSVSNVTFSFSGSSRTITDSISESFVNPFESGYTHNNPLDIYIDYRTPTFHCYQYYDSGFLPQQVSKSDICGYEYLIYRCQLSPNSVNELDFDFQINLDQSITIENVDRFQTFYGYSIGTAYSANQTNDQRIRNGNLQSNLSIYSSASDVTPIVSLQGCVWSSGWPEYFCQVSMPVTNMAPALPEWQNWSTTLQNVDNLLYPAPLMQLNVVDTGAQSSPIDISKSVYNIRAASGVSVKDGFDSSSQEWAYSLPYVYIIIMCPRIYGDFTIPEKPSGSGTIDYTNQLDQMIGQNTQTNTKLDIIIQKLDLIYQQMVSENGGVDLIDPETIGFTAQQKQQILHGVSSLDSAMDDLDAEDLPTETISSFFDVWDRITNIIPPGLMAVYIFFLVGGIASWVIFTGRGG